MTSAPRFDDRTVLELLAGILEVDPDEVEALEEQGYQTDFNQSTEVTDDGAGQIPTAK